MKFITPDEQIVYVITDYAISNTGQVYTIYGSKLEKMNNQDNTMMFVNNLGAYFTVHTDGTISYTPYNSEADYPALANWSDIIYFGTNTSSFNTAPKFCVGLTSSGAVYMALPNDSVTKRILDI